MKNRIFCVVMLFGMLFTLNLTAQGLMEGVRVFLDPGHDGFGPNDRNVATINFPLETSTGLGNDGFYESKMNVWRGLESRRILESQGAIVGLTRTTTPTAFLSTTARRDMANTFNADIYHSIHSDAFNGVVNRPLVLFTGTRHADATSLASALAWWLADNPVTSWSENPVNRNNTREQALGAISTSQMPAVLSEDSFHDYRPETHRFLSMTYNRMVAFNHYRGFLRFLDIDPASHPTGIIIGWVKDDTRSITPDFPVRGSYYLPFRTNIPSHDAYWPINGATVELLQNGTVIDTYTVDDNWNGIFGFFDLAPGTYQVRISAVGYVTEMQDVTVTGGNITAANQILALCDPNDVDCVQLFPPLRLVIGTEAQAPFGMHVTTMDIETTTHLYLGIDQNNDENSPSWINPATVTLTISDRDVAVIDDDGVITLRRAGEVLIRAVRGNDGASGEITLTLTGSNPFCNDFQDPPSDGSFGLAVSYDFVQVGTTETINPLAGLTVRRSILRDGKLYVLAVEADRSPRLLVINPDTGDLITEMSTNGIEAHNAIAHNTEITNMFILSDIGFTADGVLIGTNSTVAGAAGNQFLAGDFIVYKWQATETIALEDVDPVVFLRHLAGEGVAPLGNNNSNFVGNSIAVSGCIEDMRLFFTSHPGAGWGDRPSPDGNFNILHMVWVIEDGVRVAYNRNNTGWMSADAGARNRQLTLSPLGRDRYVFAGSNLLPTEIQFNWTPWATGQPITEFRGVTTPFSGDIPTGSFGATYFRYANRSLMVSPIAERQSDDTYSFSARLFDITDGFNNARMLGETPVGITGVPAGTRMMAAGAVDNADIFIYLIVGDQLAKFEVSDFTSGGARIFASNLVSEYNVTAGGYDISFYLNYNANSVEIILTDVKTEEETIIPLLGSFTKGSNMALLANCHIPEDGIFNWAIRASANPIARFSQIDTHSFTRPRTVAIDNSPESPYFGRVYVGNSNHASTPENQVGIFVLSPTGEDVTGQGNVARSGTETWTATVAEQHFRKLAVAEDGRVFIADFSPTNSGIYIMNPSTFAMSQMFTNSRVTTGNTAGWFGGTTLDTYIGGRTGAIGVRGGGDNTQVYAIIMHPDPANTWTQVTHRYDIGSENTWTGVPSWRRTGTSGNPNGSIVPIVEGFWAGQFRGDPTANTAANPYMYFVSGETNTVTFHTAAFPEGQGAGFGSSANGALAVYELERLVALVMNGGVQFFSYEFPPFSEGVPTVRLLYNYALGGAHEDFEFDFAGNFYAVSALTGTVGVWALPTSDNTKVTPARSSMLIERGTHEVQPIHEYSATFCAGTTFSDQFFTGLTEAGLHEVTLNDACQTIVRLTLTERPVPEVYEYTAEICEGGYFTDANFTNLTTVGVHELIVPAVNGCDSIIRLTLTVHPNVVREYTVEICDSELPFTDANFENLTVAGTFERILQTVHGCDSIIKLTLIVHPTEVYEYTREINAGESFTDENFTGLTTAGIHEVTLHTVHGCDSIIRLNLEVRTGLTVNLETAIVLYPNPARHELRIAIDGNITIKSLEIVDAYGRSVHLAINPMRSIDVSRLPQGVYFARIETDKGMVVKRFVKE